MSDQKHLTKGLEKEVLYETSDDYKVVKKQWKKKRGHARNPWRTLAIVSGVLAGVCLIAGACCYYFGNTLALYLGLDFQEVVNGDESVKYYSLDYSNDALVDKGEEVCYNLEAEGASLLKNDNEALPLKPHAKVSCFSSSSVDLVYGGTGSGNVDTSTAPNLKDGLESAGLEVNETLWDFYTEGEGSKYQRSVSSYLSMLGLGTGTSAGEVPWDVYTDEVLDSVNDYSDAAIVVFSRIGGEGEDCKITDESNYLELDETEIDMLEGLAELKEKGTIDKTIVLINSANALEVDFLFEEKYDIDACLWIGDPGSTGILAVGDIIAGNVTPSGSLADTYCKDNTTSPAMTNFEVGTYSGESNLSGAGTSYFVYQEGIYVGYRYYETRYEDYVMQMGNAGSYSYSDDVAYTFGYGLSYTDFEYSDMNVTYDSDDDMYTVSVKVTNVGDTYSGKEPVQIYAQSPYTEYDRKNGIEKASATLVGFGKTEILAPGASETLSIEVERRDLASYDAEEAKTYILDAGTYYLTAATDAHNAVNNILAAKGYGTENTSGRMDADGNSDLVFSFDIETLDSTTYSTSKNGTVITNRFDDADLNRYENSSTGVTYLSRNDWTGTFPKEIVKIAYTDGMIDDLQDVQYDPADYEDIEMPTLGADNGHKLIELMGRDYDDPLWDELLDQLTFDEMAKYIGDGFHWTMAVTSVDCPETRDENGPQGVTASMFGSSSVQGTCYTSEDVMAATLNTDLMYEMGQTLGNECLASGVDILYGPGNNTHRTPYGGRNFEYYSEDPFVSGRISTREIQGMEEKGIHVVAKHFALNDQETQRGGCCVWANEQTLREIYLKAFQEPMEEHPASGVMAAYTRIGTTWSAGNYSLITNVLRGEWGVDGLCITDNAIYSVVNVGDAVMAGTSILDAMFTFEDTFDKYENDPVIVTAMKEAMHHNMYTVVNSAAMNGITAETEIISREPVLFTVVWYLSLILTAIFVVILVIRIVCGCRFRHRFPKPKKKNYDK